MLSRKSRPFKDFKAEAIVVARQEPDGTWKAWFDHGIEHKDPPMPEFVQQGEDRAEAIEVAADIAWRLESWLEQLGYLKSAKDYWESKERLFALGFDAHEFCLQAKEAYDRKGGKLWGLHAHPGRHPKLTAILEYEFLKAKAEAIYGVQNDGKSLESIRGFLTDAMNDAADQLRKGPAVGVGLEFVDELSERIDEVLEEVRANLSTPGM
jgi:hypothetical protein